MSRTKRVLIASVLLTAGCAKIRFAGVLPKVQTKTEVKALDVDPRYELARLSQEFTTIGRGLYDMYGLSVLEPAGGFWSRTLTWTSYDEADRTLIGLMLDRILAIAQRRRQITGGRRVWEDTAPTTRAANLRSSLKAFEIRLRQAKPFVF